MEKGEEKGGAERERERERETKRGRKSEGERESQGDKALAENSTYTHTAKGSRETTQPSDEETKHPMVC